MTIGGSDSIIHTLIEQVKGLFGGKTSFTPSRSQAPTSSSGNVIPSPGGYHAPIHGSWNSSGNFDLSAVRPNGRVGHQGVDMRAPAGTPLYPLAAGTVTNVGIDGLGGNVINITHANGVRTYYAHLGTASVQKGDKVDINTVIGTVGKSGNASKTWPHCHFQVWKDGQITDPAKFFSVPPYTELSAKEKQHGQWLSPQSKQDAEAFNMKDHLTKRQATFSQELDRLIVLSHQYSKLIK